MFTVIGVPEACTAVIRFLLSLVSILDPKILLSAETPLILSIAIEVPVLLALALIVPKLSGAIATPETLTGFILKLLNSKTPPVESAINSVP